MERLFPNVFALFRILLQRFDAETCDDEETSNEQPETISFLTQLSTWQKQELDEKLASRVQVSQRAVAKIIQVFDQLNQRHERLSRLIRGEKPDGDDDDEDKAAAKKVKNETGEANENSKDEKAAPSSTSADGDDKEKADGVKEEETDDKDKVKVKKEPSEGGDAEERKETIAPTLSLDKEVKELNR